MGFSESFAGMLLSGVEPFAVYDAEKRLRASRRTVKRALLIAHYTVVGRLDSFCDRLEALDQPPTAHEAEKEAAEDIFDLGYAGSGERRFQTPLRTGLVFAVPGALLLLAALSAWDAGIFGGAPPPWDHPRELAARAISSAALLTLAGPAYSYAGARFGRGRALLAPGAALLLVLGLFLAPLLPAR